MLTSTVMIIGEPSSLRDSYELAARRHVTDVTIVDDCWQANHAIESNHLRAILITSGAGDSEIDDFLSKVRSTHPQIPVFFVGSDIQDRVPLFWLKHGTVVIPPDLHSTQLETLLFPAGSELKLLPGTRRTVLKSVTLERTEFPTDFVRAKIIFETAFITKVLQRERGNVSKTARTIGMARRNLQLKIMAYGIDINRIRRGL